MSGLHIILSQSGYLDRASTVWAHRVHLPLVIEDNIQDDFNTGAVSVFTISEFIDCSKRLLVRTAFQVRRKNETAK